MDAAKTGSFIAKLRREKGLTQQQLAERLHVTFKAVSRWETGRGLPDIENLETLSVELGTSVAELIRGERIEKALPAADADGLASDSLTLLKQLLKRQVAGNAILGFLAGTVIIMLLVIHLTSPSTLPYHEGIVEVSRAGDGTLLASLEDGVTGCDVNYVTDPDTGETVAYVSCYSKLWSRLTGTNDLGWHAPGVRHAVAIGTEDTVATVYYYPGEVNGSAGSLYRQTTWSRNALLYSSEQPAAFDAITQPRQVYRHVILATVVAGAIGLVVFTMQRRHWYARLILVASLLPLCIAASTAAVLWGKLDQVFNASFYLSGIALLSLAMYALLSLACLRFWPTADKDDQANAQLVRKARALAISMGSLMAAAFAACSLHAHLQGSFQNRTVLVPTEEYVAEHGYPKNAQGQTYGSLDPTDLSTMPDLILAQGTNGMIAYVSTDDLGLNFQPKTPEEAVAYTESLSQFRYVSVYDRDGMTVIGQYPVYGEDY